MNNRQLFLTYQAQTTHFPMMLEIERAEGCFLIDINGNRYLDLISGISVNHLGHGNEEVKAAIIDQLNLHQHVMVYGEFVQSKPALLAKKLTSLLPENLNSVYFLNSGAEATDVAMKLAKRVSQRSEIIACKNAYHGSTHAALSLNSDEYYKQAFRPLLPDINFINFNSINDLNLITTKTACVFTEVIQGEAGYIPANQDFFLALRKRCDDTGTLLVFDEIQSGMGKTGKMFAFEHYGIKPDILLLGKALGAGMPIGAVVCSREKMILFADQPLLGHISTFGGHPVVASAALAGIQVLEKNNWLSQVDAKEHLFRTLLVHPAIKSISGKGLMLAVELDSFENNLKVIQECLKEGLITDWFLFANTKIRIAPPLTITESEIEQACNIILSALNLVYGSSV
ncbi:MAG: aspartate aminotransferase family protein [Bacteroidia bacterium]|nr:aspartate aminotransferase family protein [Bacteroidia bacterium]MCF8426322.1 aspartate aminotransferase family protein [Bacteroidia bacterium]MCF8447067.1 aspartate aminotransferase family protein [Bacteroidia bacterium]